MKRIVITLAALSCAAITQAYTFSYESPTSHWVSNYYESVGSTVDKTYYFWNDGVNSGTSSSFPGVSTNGVGQIFNVTNSFTVDEIRIYSQRWYYTNDLQLTIYKDVVLDPLTLDTPSMYMVPSNIVAQFTLDPGGTAPRPNSGAGNGDILVVALETNEYFDLSPIGTFSGYTNYYLHIDFQDVDIGTNTPDRLFLWRWTGGDTNGYFITPDGIKEDAANGRDLGIAFHATNEFTVPPPPLPDIPTNWILPQADTYVRHYENGKQDTNYGTDLDISTRHYYSGDVSNPLSYRDYNTYIRFDLTPYAGATITNATLGITRMGGGSLVNGRVRFLGLDNVVSNTPQDWVETSLTANTVGAEHFDYALNSSGATDGLVVSNRLTDFEEGTSNIVETVSGDNASITGQALVDWLNTRLADADTNGTIYATFIVDFPYTGGNQSVWYFSRENLGTYDQDKLPHLILDYIPAGPTGPQFDPTITSIAVSGGTVTIGWDSDTNGTYRVEKKDALSDVSWAPVSGASNLTGGASQSTPVSAGGGNAEFYRIYGE